MKKIEKRAGVCLLLAAALLLGLCFFCFRYATSAGKWVSFAANQHLYNRKGQLSVGRIMDRDGDLLSWVDPRGNRTYYENQTVRKATLHAVGDASGRIGTGALVAFADKLSGYNMITGAYSPLGAGNDLYLTLDARYNYIAYNALNGRKGAVGLYNYKTGEILCMVSTPTFDPLNPPETVEGDERYEGVYLNRFLSGAFVPGSVFKTVTLAAAIENIPDLFDRRFTCTGSTDVGGEGVGCPKAHGEMDIQGALAQSCNGVFARLAAELGPEVMQTYADRSGLTSRYKVSGIHTASGRVALEDATENQLGWAGVGQYSDAVNPCALMVYMGAIANGGKAAVPQLVRRTENSLGMNVSPYIPHATDKLIDRDTATTMADMMAQNVVDTYGAERFSGMDLCAKSGTGEVGGGKAPNAWFTGFLRDEATPYAFVVLVENGGSGADVAGNIAAKLLNAAVNGYE
ncbi:MAG: penicillin-binding transpeptidase domain-containing protein [Pseudoflavonifractor sp.]